MLGKRLLKQLKLQSQEVAAHKAFNKVIQLQSNLKTAGEDNWNAQLRGSGLSATKTQKVKTLQTGFLASASKPHQFISCEESSWQFLKNVCVKSCSEAVSPSRC